MKICEDEQLERQTGRGFYDYPQKVALIGRLKGVFL